MPYTSIYLIIGLITFFINSFSQTIKCADNFGSTAAFAKCCNNYKDITSSMPSKIEELISFVSILIFA